jgi:DNA-binding NtrC family response regulator
MTARILVVDDEPDMLALMKMMLEEKGYEVIVTNNPLEVGELLESQKVDIVLTDLKMPGLDGIEVLSEVKRRDPEVTVMVITAYGSLESAEEAIERGAFDFITKPFRKEQVLLAVDKALRWREIVRQNEELRRKLEQT